MKFLSEFAATYREITKLVLHAILLLLTVIAVIFITVLILTSPSFFNETWWAFVLMPFILMAYITLVVQFYRKHKTTIDNLFN